MPVERIDHVQLAMPAGGEDRARRFYEGLLGLPEVPKPPHLAARGGCWFEGPAVKVHLGVEAEFRPARKAHPALLVRDLGGVVGALRAAGVPVGEDEPLEGYERVYVEDPFGNRIELLEPHPAPATIPGGGREGPGPLEVVEAFGKAWEAHDLDAAVAMVTEDCVFESTAPAPDGSRFVGPDAIRRAWEPIFADAASRFDAEETFAAPDMVVQRWRYSWDGGHVRGVDVMRVRDGKVAEKLSYVKG